MPPKKTVSADERSKLDKQGQYAANVRYYKAVQQGNAGQKTKPPGYDDFVRTYKPRIQRETPVGVTRPVTRASSTATNPEPPPSKTNQSASHPPPLSIATNPNFSIPSSAVQSTSNNNTAAQHGLTATSTETANRPKHPNLHQQAPITTAYSLANATGTPAFRRPSEIDSTTRDATQPSNRGKGKDQRYQLPGGPASDSSTQPAGPPTSANTTRIPISRGSFDIESSSRDVILPSIEYDIGSAPHYSAPEQHASNSSARPAAPHTSPNARMPVFRRPPEFGSPEGDAMPPPVEEDLYGLSPPRTTNDGNTRPRGQGINSRSIAVARQLRTQGSLHMDSTHAGSSRAREGSPKRKQPPPSRGRAAGRPTRGRSSTSPTPPARHTQAPRHRRGPIPSRGTIRGQSRGTADSSDNEGGPAGPRGSTRARPNPMAVHITAAQSELASSRATVSRDAQEEAPISRDTPLHCVDVPFEDLQPDDLDPGATRDSEDSGPDEMIEFDAVEHFVEHFSSSFFCSNDDHSAQFTKHCEALEANDDSHKACEGLGDIASRTDPKMPQNHHIPNFLGKRYIYRGEGVLTAKRHTVKATPDLTIKAQLLSESTKRLMYEGRSQGNEQRRRLCMFNSEYQTGERAPWDMPDIDSACGETTSFGGFKTGISFYPYANLPMSGKTHGIRLEIKDDDAPKGYWMVPPEEIPGILFATLPNWAVFNIYMIFPKMWLKRRNLRDQTTYLTKKQRKELYDLVIYPAILRAFSGTDTTAIPASFDIAMNEAEASSYERGRQGEASGSRLQMLHHHLQPQGLHEFTEQCRINISLYDLDYFEGFRIWFSAKGFKDVFRCLTYTELYSQWSSKWNQEIDARYTPSRLYWLDLGRQLSSGASDDGTENALLWKPCCIQRYWARRTKPFRHSTILPLHKFYLAGCRDIISATITATSDSAPFHKGAPFSQFYSRSKSGQVTATISVFESADINILAHGTGLVQAIASAGGASTATIQGAATAAIHGYARADGAIDQLAKVSSQAREEHRIRGDIFEEIMERLMDLEDQNGQSVPRLDSDESDESDEQDAQRPENIWKPDSMTPFGRKVWNSMAEAAEGVGNDPTALTRHLPIWRLPAVTFASFLRGNLNKACMGFEVSLRQINSSRVPQHVTATALMFLSSMRYSTLSKSLNLAPELFRDRWTPAPAAIRRIRGIEQDQAGSPSSSSDDEVRVTSEGMGMSSTMKEFGYMYFQPKMNWPTWSLHPDRAENFFRREPEFVLAYRARRGQVVHIWEASTITGLIGQWLAKADTPRKMNAVIDFTHGFLMTLFRNAVWAQLKNNKVLTHLPDSQQTLLLSGKVPITYSNIARYVQDFDPAVPRNPDLSSSNSTFHKGDPMVILEYIFGHETPFRGGLARKPKKRDNWGNQPFRNSFHEVFLLLANRLSAPSLESWKRDFYCVVHVTNPLLPNSDGTQLISRKQNSMGYGWLAFKWLNGLPPFQGPVSSQQLVRGVYPNGAGNQTTKWCSRNEGEFFDGVPPTLQFEKEFLEKSAMKMERVMMRKWEAFGRDI